MCDTSSLGSSPAREGDVRAAIGAILANKYKGGPSTSDPDSTVMKQVFEFWGEWMHEATTSSPIPAESFHAYNTVALNVLAGAAARQDKHVLSIVPALHQAAASQHLNGEIVAKSLGLVVKQNELLTSDNHAVVKRFYKQWAYSQLVEPLLQDAQPATADSHAAARYRVTILSIVSHCPFTVYQDDLEHLIRLLVTALNNPSGLSEEVAWSQAVSALEILADIFANEPGALQGHLREIVGGTTRVYQECSLKKEKSAAVQPTTRAACRKLALQVLGVIPTRFEERHVLPYAPPTQRMLAVACGDPVRKVREVARLARANWAKVV